MLTLDLSCFFFLLNHTCVFSTHPQRQNQNVLHKHSHSTMQGTSTRHTDVSHAYCSSHSKPLFRIPQPSMHLVQYTQLCSTSTPALPLSHCSLPVQPLLYGRLRLITTHSYALVNSSNPADSTWNPAARAPVPHSQTGISTQPPLPVTAVLVQTKPLYHPTPASEGQLRTKPHRLNILNPTTSTPT